jgi:hypothetical protein
MEIANVSDARNLKEVLCEIEKRRRVLEKMIVLGAKTTDPEVIAASQALDCVLNEYERLIREENKK